MRNARVGNLLRLQEGFLARVGKDGCAPRQAPSVGEGDAFPSRRSEAHLKMMITLNGGVVMPVPRGDSGMVGESWRSWPEW